MAATAPAYEKIGPTAHVTAYAWYQLGMPYGQLFATREGAAMYWTFRHTADRVGRRFGVPSLLDYLEFRHRMLEAQLERLQPDVIVELGAGLSRRGITWVLDHGIRYVEIDLPHMTLAKRRMLEGGAGRVLRALRDESLLLRSSDIFSADFPDELAELLQGAARPVVLSEGMLDYFELPVREALLRNLVAGLRRVGGGHYLTDLQHAERERRFGPAATVLRQAIKLATRGQGPARPFRDLEHVDRVFALAGFDEGLELRPRDLAERQPRLRQLRSPTTLWLAAVNHDSAKS